MSYYIVDSANARLNTCTLIDDPCGRNGIAYNAVISVSFSAESGTEPVTLQQAKDWAKIDVTDDDALITAIITGARIVCENIANLSFVRRTVTAKIHNGLGNFYLPYGPVVGDITSVTDSSGNPITDLDLSKPYSSDVTVVYEAGYVTLPENLKTALKNQIVYLEQNRGDEKKESGVSPISKLLLNQVRNV